jgi:hypothetical protein
MTRIVTPLRKTARLVLWASRHRRPRVAYVGGWKGNANLGDELLYTAMTRLFPRCSFFESRGERYETLLAKVYRPFTASVLAGGTLINRSIRYLRTAGDAFPLSPASFVFGSGVAHPGFWKGRADGKQPWVDTRSQWVELLRRCAYVGVRGPDSAAHLAEAGLEGVEVIGDPVLALATDGPRGDVRERSIGLNLGTAGGQMLGDEAAVIAQFVALARRAGIEGWTVEWFVVWPADLPIVRQAAEESGTGEVIHELYTDHERFLELGGRMAVFVGMKLHAVALATCAQVPSAMVEYRPKCRDYMRSIDQEHLTIRPDDFRADEAWERVREIASDRDAHVARLRDGVLPLRDRQKERANEIEDRLMAMHA